MEEIKLIIKESITNFKALGKVNESDHYKRILES